MSWLIQKLSQRHPELNFAEGDLFSWSPSSETIFYNTDLPNSAALLLHEVSHALLGHRNYQRDVELVAMEAEAWEKAKIYASELIDECLAERPSLDDELVIDESSVEDHVDTYRDWLHARSTCPECTATGYQVDKSSYTCPACSHRWRVNEARMCALRRYSNK